MRYVYLGDKMTDPRYINQPCDPVLRADGKALVGTGKGVPRNQLVRFQDGVEVVVLGRRLRVDPQVKLGEETQRRRESDIRNGRDYS